MDNYWYSKSKNRLAEIPADIVVFALRNSHIARRDLDEAYAALDEEQKARIDEILTYRHEITPKKSAEQLGDERQSRANKQKVFVRKPRKLR